MFFFVWKYFLNVFNLKIMFNSSSLAFICFLENHNMRDGRHYFTVKAMGGNVLLIYGFKCVSMVAFTLRRVNTTSSLRLRHDNVAQGSIISVISLWMLKLVHCLCHRRWTLDFVRETKHLRSTFDPASLSACSLP